MSLAHDLMVHAPAWIVNNTFGKKSFIFDVKVENNAAISVSSLVTIGLVIADNKFVPAESQILIHKQAYNIPSRIGNGVNENMHNVLHVNKESC